MVEMELADHGLTAVFELFFDEYPIEVEIKNTSHGESDFREAVLLRLESGSRYVIKLADNDFTFADKIRAWQRCSEEYRKLGYYCPAIICSKNGDFPTIRYKGHNCVVYAEEYSKYRSADDSGKGIGSNSSYLDDALIMTAKVAAARLDFTDYPSGYCLFERFCPSDPVDEVMENALAWKEYTETLPAECQEQVRRIWNRWIENRKELELIYPELPTSVFQADLNASNILVDGQGKFVGVYDFNLCGKDVFLNYLFREIFCSDEEEELRQILAALLKVSEVYCFSEIEKKAAVLLYRCLKPLWFIRVQKLKAAGENLCAIKACLDKTEFVQTREIEFAFHMEGNGE